MIQNKFAQLHGKIVEIKEKNRRTFSHESALNFTGSISPVRVPDFEVDFNLLSKISSPGMMEELGRKYEGSVDMIFEEKSKVVESCGGGDYVGGCGVDDDGLMDHIDANYDEPTVIPRTPLKSPRKATTAMDTDQNNFPTVISPMKRAYKQIEAESKRFIL